MMNELTSANKESTLEATSIDFDLCELCTKKRQQRKMIQKFSDQNQRRRLLQEEDHDEDSKASRRGSKGSNVNREEVKDDEANYLSKENEDKNKRPPKIPPRQRPPVRKNEADLEASPAMFTITPNPISSEANEDATASVKKLPDYCLPAEDASQHCVTPPEIALLQKRIQFRRILPCLNFEDLERERMEIDASRLELMDSRLAEAHRVVMQRTANRYLVMEAATFGDKLFTGSLIILTILAILVLFWFRNFGPGLVKHVVDQVDHL